PTILLRRVHLNSAFDVYRLFIDAVSLPETFSRPSASHLEAVNDFVQLVNPGLSWYDYLHRTILFEYGDFDMPPVENLVVDFSRLKAYVSGEFVVSKILGKGERGRPDSLRQGIISLSHRNFAAPRINERLDVYKTAERLCASLVKTFDFSKLYENYDVVLPDIHKIDDWLQDRDGSKLGRIKRDMNHTLLSEKFNSLKFMIKGDMKPKMDMSSYSSYSPPANIIYYNHIISMFFSPLFLEVFDRIVYCLNSKIVMFSGMNLDVLASLISSKLDKPLGSYYTLEIDFSKFDKSQGILFKTYEGMLYRFFKFSEDYYTNIEATEYFIRYKGRCGLAGELGAQRRTGSPNTWLSNTLVTMGIVLSMYSIDDIDLFLVSGDDSLIFSSKPLANRTGEINRDFGFEAKMVENSVPYFCSKFIIEDRGKIKVVPDPVRFFEKLSTPIRCQDFLSEDLMAEKFRSFKDLMKDYVFDTTCLLVDSLVSYRYSLPPMCSYAALCYIHCLLANFHAFKKIFQEDTIVLI
ncbi:RNA dependent RNA polymerase, partial [polyscias crinivirus 1]